VSQGSTFDAVNRADLSKLALPSPPLHEQRRIAEILSSVDEAIAATQAVIEQTRKVKQGVLERLLTKGIGYTRFKQTEIGEIPEGWDVGRISNIGEVMVGRQRSPSFTEGLDFPYLRVANVFDNLIDTSDVLKMKFTDVEVERYLLRAGDILLNEGQSLHLVGRNARYEGNPSACCFQNTLIRFRARELTDLDYAFALMQFLFFKGRFSEIATQTTSVAHLGSNRFGGLLVPVPPLEEQRKIGGIHNSLLETEARQRSQLDQLLSKKSALMSDLLTGRKRVTDALPMAAE
jgi:type I restriction enzyme S subunit